MKENETITLPRAVLEQVREALRTALRDDTGDKYNDYDTLYYAIEAALTLIDQHLAKGGEVVSLEKCAKAIYESKHSARLWDSLEPWTESIPEARAALDAAGVKYVD